MQLSCALLCDAATAREGLLHILGGGVSRVMRPAYPTNLGLSLAIALNLLPEELAGEHRIEFRLFRVGGGDKAIATHRLEFNLEAPPEGLLPGEDGLVALVMPVDAALPEPGVYRFEVDVDDGGTEMASTFRAVPS